MRVPRSFRVENFRLAQRRDGALREDRLWSLRSLINMDIDYEDGRLRMRPGYERWNETALPAVAEQLYDFVDLSGNQHLLGICNSRWYEFKETGAHVLLVDEAATAPRPVVAQGNRIFFATDSGWYWTDDTVIATADRAHRAGIVKPSEGPTLASYAAPGHDVGVWNATPNYLNTDTRRRIGIKFTLATPAKIGSVHVAMRRPVTASDLPGNVQAQIFDDDGGSPGVPSTTLAHVDAISEWHPVSAMQVGSYTARKFSFKASFDLSAGDYWIVLYSDADYRTYFSLVGGSLFYAEIGCDTPTPADYDFLHYYNLNAGPAAWQSTNVYEPEFYIGGVDAAIYDYVITFYNSSYNSESRPSDPSRVEATAPLPVIGIIGYPGTADGQVDKTRAYRRTVPAWDSVEGDITDDYNLVAEVDAFLAIWDTQLDEHLGLILDSQDHYAIGDIDDTGSGLRDAAIIPSAACYWHDRILVANGSNRIWMSKIFERDNASGLTNDPTEDYFPLSNRLDMAVASGIIALEPMSDDQLIVYFMNGSVWIIWGTYESLNPPPDIARREQLSTGGLFTARGMDKTSRRHVIITSEGLWGFAGTTGIPELLSETNQSLLTDIENDYLDNTRVVVFGGEIWLLVDLDNDGNLETVMILDMIRDIPSRQIVDRAWRMYQYNVALKDMVLRKRGDTQQHILAADAENPYILRLGTGTTDNGNAIVGTVEMHNVRARNLVMLSGIELDAKYPGTAPTYTITGYASDGSEKTYSLSPSSDQDIRKHRTGMQVLAVGDARVKIEITSTQADELKSFLLSYVTE